MIERFIEIKAILDAKNEVVFNNTTEIALQILKLEQQQKIWDQQKNAMNTWFGSGENRPVFLAALESYNKLR